MIGSLIIDEEGVLGSFFHYGLTLAFTFIAFFFFFYLWSQKRLDMDEQPKFIMLEEEDHEGSRSARRD